MLASSDDPQGRIEAHRTQKELAARQAVERDRMLRAYQDVITRYMFDGIQIAEAWFLSAESRRYLRGLISSLRAAGVQPARHSRSFKKAYLSSRQKPTEFVDGWLVVRKRYTSHRGMAAAPRVVHEHVLVTPTELLMSPYRPQTGTTNVHPHRDDFRPEDIVESVIALLAASKAQWVEPAG